MYEKGLKIANKLAVLAVEQSYVCLPQRSWLCDILAHCFICNANENLSPSCCSQTVLHFYYVSITLNTASIVNKCCIIRLFLNFMDSLSLISDAQLDCSKEESVQ